MRMRDFSFCLCFWALMGLAACVGEEDLRYEAFHPTGGEEDVSEELLELFYHQLLAGQNPYRGLAAKDLIEGETPFPAERAREMLSQRGIDFPAGAGAVFDFDRAGWGGWNIIARNTSENLAAIRKVVGDLEWEKMLSPSLYLQTLRVPTDLASTWTTTSLESPAHGWMLAEAEEAIGRGEGTRGFEATLRLHPQKETVLTEGEKFGWLDHYAPNHNGNPAPVRREVVIGTSIRVDSSWGGSKVYLGIVLERHHAPPVSTQGEITLGEERLPIDLCRFHRDRLEMEPILIYGQTRLLAIWPAREGVEVIEDQVDVTFIQVQHKGGAGD